MTINRNEEIDEKRKQLSALMAQAAAKLGYDEVDRVVAKFRVNKILNALNEYRDIKVEDVDMFDASLHAYSPEFLKLKKMCDAIVDYVDKNQNVLLTQSVLQSYQELVGFVNAQTKKADQQGCTILSNWLRSLSLNVGLDVIGLQSELNRAMANTLGPQFKETKETEVFVTGEVNKYLMYMHANEKYAKQITSHTNIKNEKFNYPLTEKSTPSAQLCSAFVKAAFTLRKKNALVDLKNDKGLEKLFFYTQRIAHLKVKYNKCGGLLGMGGGVSKNPIFDKIEKEVAVLIAQYPKKSLKEIYQDSKIMIDEIIKNKGITVSDSKAGVQKIDLGNKEALSIVKGLQDVLPRLMLADEADLMKEAKAQQNKAPSVELVQDIGQHNMTFRRN